MGPSPPARSPRPLSRPLSGPGVTAPDSRRAPPRHSPSFVSECALGAEVPSTCVGPVPPGRSRRRAAPHKGDRGLGRPARPGHRSAPGPAPAPREGRAREGTPPPRKPSARRPPGLPPRVSLAPTQPARGGRADRPGPTALSEGGEGRSLLTPTSPRGSPGKPARGGGGGLPGPAERQRGCPAAAAPRRAPEPRRPAGLPARQRRVTCAPRPSPRRSRAPLPRATAASAAGAPPPSASQWVSDAPGPSAKPGSPIPIAFIWPPLSNQAPPRLAGREAGSRPITGPAGL